MLLCRVEGEKLGRVEIEVLKELLPVTSKNFLVRGANKEGTFGCA